MSDLVGNPEDRFSRVEAQVIPTMILYIVCPALQFKVNHLKHKMPMFRGLSDNFKTY